VVDNVGEDGESRVLEEPLPRGWTEDDESSYPGNHWARMLGRVVEVH